MADVTLDFPAFTCVVSAPSGVIDSLARIYPRSLTPGSSRAQADASFTIETEASGWSLERDGRSTGTFDTPEYALLALEYQIESEVIAIDDGRVALHAGAVETPSGAWLIAGDPDSGKTTSTFQLLQLGQKFLCEEVSLYDPERSMIHPYPQTPAMDRRYVDRFARHLPVVNGTLWHLDDSVTRFIPDRISLSPRPLRLLLLPRYRPDEPSEIVPLVADQVLTEVLGYCFPPARGEEQLIDTMISLLDHTPTLRVTYSSILEARRLYSRLLDQGSEAV